jgi:hypothetical protein
LVYFPLFGILCQEKSGNPGLLTDKMELTFFTSEEICKKTSSEESFLSIFPQDKNEMDLKKWLPGKKKTV